MPVTDKKCSINNNYAFASETKVLQQARNLVAEIAADCGFSEQIVFDIKLAAGEAIANAIEHGSPNGKNNSINIKCYCENDDFIVIVRDEGRFKKKLPVGTGDNVNFRGRGVLIMLALMDKVIIDETKSGTSVHLSKRYR